MSERKVLNVSKTWISCPFFPIPQKIADIKVKDPKMRSLKIFEPVKRNHSNSYNGVFTLCCFLGMSDDLRT